jgi:localization factor PodJL
MSQGNWSLKGVDPKARLAARERASARGQTLGEYLNGLLLDSEEPDAPARTAEPPAAAGRDLKQLSTQLDQLSERLEASDSRHARTLSGIDRSILTILGRGEAASENVERLGHALQQIEATQTALRARMETLESDPRARQTLDTLRMLERSLSRLAEATDARDRDFRQAMETRIEGLAQQTEAARNAAGALGQGVKAELAAVRSRLARTDAALEAADRKTDAARSRLESIETSIQSLEARGRDAIEETRRQGQGAAQTAIARARAAEETASRRAESAEAAARAASASLQSAISGLTERIDRAERRSDSISTVFERSIEDIDARLSALPDVARLSDLARIETLVLERLEAFSRDMAAPVAALRTEMDARLNEALSTALRPEAVDQVRARVERLEDQIAETRHRQASAIDALTEQVGRMADAVDQRLRTLEAGGALDDMRHEFVQLAEVMQARLTQAEQDSARAVSEVGERLEDVAERLKAQLETGLVEISRRLEEPHGVAAPTERLEERIRDSERRSADAISQIGEQVARVGERLNAQTQDAMRALEARLAVSGREHEARLADVLTEMSRRLEDMSEHTASALTPVRNTLSSLARRISDIEDKTAGGAAPAASPDVAPPVQDAPDVDEERIFLPPQFTPPAAGGDPRAALAFTITEILRSGPDEGAPATRTEDLLETDDVVLEAEGPAAPPPAVPPAARPDEDEPLTADASETVEPDGAQAVAKRVVIEDPLAAEPEDYLARARRAAQQNRPALGATPSGGRNRSPSAPSTSRKGVGRGPLMASAALAIAVAGGGAWTIMRGKQDPGGDTFTQLDPAQPADLTADPAGTADDLFDAEGAETPRGPLDSPPPSAAAAQATAEALFEETAAAPVRSTGRAPPATRPTPASPTGGGAPPPRAASPRSGLTLADAVAAGDPVALYDSALELLQAGERSKALLYLKEAASKGLVMAQYRLAKMHEKGEGVPRDMAAARNWTEQAAIGGNIKAMHDLAVFYAEGDSGPQSYAAAVEWFRQASDHGLVDSQYNLAILYEQGLGVSKDLGEAALWFEIAGRSGDPDAGRRARALMSSMPAADADEVRRRARAFAAKPGIASANGEFPKRFWEAP